VSEAASPVPPVTGAGPFRVLVVDDDDIDRQVVRRGLARAGVEARVDEAATGDEAVALLEANAYECVFLDYNLPGTNGLALLRSLRAAGVRVPVVMLTGHGDEQVAVELMKAGAVDYVPKAAASPERLTASLRYAVELSRAEAGTRAAQQELRASVARAGFLAEASRVLAGSLDVRGTLEQVARLSVPVLGDYCALYMTDGAGHAAAVASAHDDAERAPLLAGLEGSFRPALDHPTSAVAEVIRTGRTRLMETITPGHLDSVADGAEQRAALARLAPASALFVPLVAREVMGAAAFCRGAGRAPFTADEVALAEDLARRAGTALDNARLYEQAKAARAEAEEANRAKSDFLARMSHDLRTPLNAIGGYADLVQMGIHGPVTPAQDEAMGRIRRAQQHLLALINDILSFARLEAGQVRLELETVEVAHAFLELQPLAEPLAADKGLRLEVERPAAGLRVRADRDRLAQVLLNLLSNAVKFTESGSVSMAAEDTGTGVAIRVTDTGPGIPADRLEEIFDPFVQAGNSSAARRQGVGLGLAISRELARMMEGTLSVSSTPGEGSTFTLTLPRAE